jgi:hypothetical protein
MFDPSKLGSTAQGMNAFPPAPPLEGFNPFGMNIDQSQRMAKAMQAMEKDNQMQAPSPVSFGGAPQNPQLLDFLAKLRGGR